MLDHTYLGHKVTIGTIVGSLSGKTFTPEKDIIYGCIIFEIIGILLTIAVVSGWLYPYEQTTNHS